MTSQPNTIDDILNNYIGRIETYKKVHHGYPESMTGDREHARNVTKAALLEAIKAAIGEDEIPSRIVDDRQIVRIRNALRSSQRNKLVNLFGGKQ